MRTRAKTEKRDREGDRDKEAEASLHYRIFTVQSATRVESADSVRGEKIGLKG